MNGERWINDTRRYRSSNKEEAPHVVSIVHFFQLPQLSVTERNENKMMNNPNTKSRRTWQLPTNSFSDVAVAGDYAADIHLDNNAQK